MRVPPVRGPGRRLSLRGRLVIISLLLLVVALLASNALLVTLLQRELVHQRVDCEVSLIRHQPMSSEGISIIARALLREPSPSNKFHSMNEEHRGKSAPVR